MIFRVAERSRGTTFYFELIVRVGSFVCCRRRTWETDFPPLQFGAGHIEPNGEAKFRYWAMCGLFEIGRNSGNGFPSSSVIDGAEFSGLDFFFWVWGCSGWIGFIWFHFFLLLPISDQDGSLKREDSPVEPHENGVDVDNDDELPIMGDLDGMDGDPNDMNRPRKIRRWVSNVVWVVDYFHGLKGRVHWLRPELDVRHCSNLDNR